MKNKLNYFVKTVPRNIDEATSSGALKYYPSDPYYQFYNTPLYTLTNIKSYWKIEITNVGNKEIKDIRVELPLEGYYSIEHAEAATFDKTIDIGVLRSSSSLNVEIWSSSFIGFTTSDNIRVTYPDGSKKVDFPVPVSKFDSNLVHYVKLGGELLAVFAAMLVAVFTITYLLSLMISSEVKVSAPTFKKHNIPRRR